MPCQICPSVQLARLTTNFIRPSVKSGKPRVFSGQTFVHYHWCSAEKRQSIQSSSQETCLPSHHDICQTHLFLEYYWLFRELVAKWDWIVSFVQVSLLRYCTALAQNLFFASLFQFMLLSHIYIHSEKGHLDRLGVYLLYSHVKNEICSVGFHLCLLL